MRTKTTGDEVVFDLKNGLTGSGEGRQLGALAKFKTLLIQSKIKRGPVQIPAITNNETKNPLPATKRKAVSEQSIQNKVGHDKKGMAPRVVPASFKKR